MKNTYNVSLINADGGNFDNAEFTNLDDARKWAKGRGQTFNFDEWMDYTVKIRKNGEDFEEYKTH